MGWIVTRQGETYIFQYGNTPRSVTFKSLAISLIEGKIKLEEFGRYKMTLTFSQIDTIGNIVPTDIENAYDLIIGLGQPPYPINYNFDFEYEGTQIFDNYGIEDEATFIAFLEGFGATDIIITDFELTSSRLRCNLLFSDMVEIGLGSLGMTKVNNFSALVNLTGLDLTLSNLTTIENISELINLTQLYYDHNNILVIENLDTLVNLTYLTLNNNQITTIENLDTLVNLTNLDLQNNQITTTEFNKLNSWALVAPSGGTIGTSGNIDNFNLSTTYTTLLGKGWSINL